jgi:8-oxo-dGTP pyrophosphatase MutT (NUDIX family)
MDARNRILRQLRAYRGSDRYEEKMRLRILAFVERHKNCFERNLREGHITGSAWIVNRTHTRVLLLHHGKLGRWLQPGGHWEGDPDVLRVALREAREETGLTRLKLVSRGIFDVDAHRIPLHKKAPAHTHYDIRYLVEADGRERLGKSEESRDLRWVKLKRVSAVNSEESIMRMVRKTSPRKR